MGASRDSRFRKYLILSVFCDRATFGERHVRWDMGRGLRRDDQEGSVALKHPNASEH